MTINVVGRANLAKYFLVAILCNLLVMGCTVSVPQVESSYRFMKDLISPDNVPSQEQQALWLASVGDRGAVLRPYSSGGLTVFANTDGDAIAFDGWTIRSLGLGSKVRCPLQARTVSESFARGPNNVNRMRPGTKCTGAKSVPSVMGR